MLAVWPMVPHPSRVTLPGDLQSAQVHCGSPCDFAGQLCSPLSACVDRAPVCAVTPPSWDPPRLTVMDPKGCSARIGATVDGKHRGPSVHSSLSGLSSQGVNSIVSWPLPQRPGNSPGALDSPVCLPIGEIQSNKSTDSNSVELWDLVRTNQQRTRGFGLRFRVAHTGDVPPSKVYKLA